MKYLGFNFHLSESPINLQPRILIKTFVPIKKVSPTNHCKRFKPTSLAIILHYISHSIFHCSSVFPQFVFPKWLKRLANVRRAYIDQIFALVVIFCILSSIFEDILLTNRKTKIIKDWDGLFLEAIIHCSIVWSENSLELRNNRKIINFPVSPNFSSVSVSLCLGVLGIVFIILCHEKSSRNANLSSKARRFIKKTFVLIISSYLSKLKHEIGFRAWRRFSCLNFVYFSNTDDSSKIFLQ